MNIKWKKSNHVDGKYAFVGDKVLGYAGYNGMRSRHDPETNKYKWNCKLPGCIPSDTGFCSTQEQAEKYLEEMINSWFKQIGIEQ